MKRLDDGQPLVEVARKMKAIEGMQPQINDMERRLGIMQSVEPVLENAIKTLQKVVDVRGMGKSSSLLQVGDDVLESEPDDAESSTVDLIVSDFGEPTGEGPKHNSHNEAQARSSDENTMTIDGQKVSIDESNDFD